LGWGDHNKCLDVVQALIFNFKYRYCGIQYVQKCNKKGVKGKTVKQRQRVII